MDLIAYKLVKPSVSCLPHRNFAYLYSLGRSFLTSGRDKYESTISWSLGKNLAIIGPPWKLYALTKLRIGLDVFWIESEVCSISDKRSSILDSSDFDSVSVFMEAKYWSADTRKFNNS